MNATSSSITARLTIKEGINHPPMFDGDLKALKIDLNTVYPYLQYTLPEIVDHNDHQVVMKVDDVPEFGKFDRETNTFTFQQIRDEHVGQYEIFIALIDEKFLEAKFTLKLEVMSSYVDLSLLFDKEKS